MVGRTKTKRTRWAAFALAAGVAISVGPDALAQEVDYDARIKALESTLQQVVGELDQLKQERDAAKLRADEATARSVQLEQQQQALIEEVTDLQDADEGILPGLHLGGYGEHHFNFVEGEGGDISDIHRFVAFVGYDFADWVHFNSETEIEHGFVSDDDGEISIEQFYLDFNIARPLNFRVGRMLHPAGIVNRYHEPTRFYGVERPTFSKNVLPSTWSIDGAGFWGEITEWLSYEVYIHAGLDGSGFSGGSGLRGGRVKERPSLNDPGVSGRVDIFPLTAMQIDGPVTWRTGFSYSYIGTENGNKAADAGRPEGTVQIAAFDTDVRWRNLEFRGEAAFVDNGAADQPGAGAGVSDEIFGAYVQLAYRWLPDSWKAGRLANSDAVIFARYDYSDPQYGVVTNGTRDRSKSLREIIFGVSFYPVRNVVLKADYTIADSIGGDKANRYDFGVGYEF